MVYNHTAEGDVDGPTLSFRGLDDRAYYQRVDHAAGDPFVDTYWDVTGCGNTLDAADPLALRLVLDSLRYWVTEMHVDGFRFDLASALARTGRDRRHARPLLIAIGQDPMLRHVKLIAEPWDVRRGRLPGRRVPAAVGRVERPVPRHRPRLLARRRRRHPRPSATGSPARRDLYADDGRSPSASVNFVTAHDGFTLRDLVSYERKHNEANGEGNRDGTDDNRSQNHGVEGETDDAEIAAPASAQAANLLVTLCLSTGVPMITAGDERAARRAATTTPTARTTRSRGSTGVRTTPGSTSTTSPRRRSGCGGSIPRCGSGTASRGDPRSTAAARTSPGCTPRAAR